jgi:hypothetical protein
MTPPPRNVAHTRKLRAEATEETPQTDNASSLEDPVSDDSAGDEGIDEPADD